jgi:sec-independent protein translocase protein TatA
MRIIKSEVKEMKNDGKPEAKDGSDPVEGKVVNHPQSRPQNGDSGTGSADGTDVPPSNRV